MNLFESMAQGGPVLYDKSGLKSMSLWLDILGTAEPQLKPYHSMLFSAVCPGKL